MKIKVLLAVFLSLFVFSPTNAQQSKSPEELSRVPSLLSPSVDEIEGTVNCFDYYEFGSVQVDISSALNSTIPGVPMGFRGIVTNNNNYPVVDGQVFIKVFKKQKDDDLAHANGFFLVDQFLASDNISLAAKGTKEVTFNWTVPNYAEPGEYQIVSYFTSAKKFNLLGLTFTDDINGNIFDFTVKGQNARPVEFNKNTVSINGKNHHFAAFIPQIGKDTEVSIKTDLDNPTDVAQKIPVTWTLYQWDFQNEKNIIQTKKETVTVEAKSTKNLEYKITHNKHPVYLLVVEANYQGAKSILNIRFAREGVDQTRINFPAVTKYPLAGGESNTLFSCVHGMGQSGLVKDNKLVLTLVDQDGKEIHTYSYTGDISGAMMGLKDDFTPEKTYANFTLKADLYRNNQLVDSAEMKYDCNSIDPSLCAADETYTSGRIADTLGKPSKAIPIIIAVLAVAIAIGYAIKKKMQIDKGRFIVFFVAFVLGGALLFGSAGKAEAKSVTWNKQENYTYSYHNTRWGQSGYPPGLENPNISITYAANVYNNATSSLIPNNGQVSVGTVLRFVPKPFEDTDISWFGTGYSSDSPYGHWKANASAPHVSCDDNDFVSSYTYTGFPFTSEVFDVYIPLSVSPPSTVTISHSGSTAGLNCNAQGTVCTVTSPGIVKGVFTYAQTSGYFYYRYYDFRSGDGVNGDKPGCFGNNDKMKICSDMPCILGICWCQENTDYTLNVPIQVIDYTINVVGNNSPPALTISGPTSGKPNTSNTFSFTAVDHDGDTLNYQIDWDMLRDSDTTPKQYTVDQVIPIPPPDFVPSGTLQSANNPAALWTTSGSKTFQAKACDEHGLCSDWKTYTITLDNVEIPCSGSYSGTRCLEDIGGIGPGAWHQATPTATKQSDCTSARCEYYIPNLPPPPPPPSTQSGWKEVAP